MTCRKANLDAVLKPARHVTSGMTCCQHGGRFAVLRCCGIRKAHPVISRAVTAYTVNANTITNSNIAIIVSPVPFSGIHTPLFRGCVALPFLSLRATGGSIAISEPSLAYEIASVVSLLHKEFVTQPLHVKILHTSVTNTVPSAEVSEFTVLIRLIPDLAMIIPVPLKKIFPGGQNSFHRTCPKQVLEN